MLKIIKRVLVIVAMEKEALPIMESLHLTASLNPIDPELPSQIASKKTDAGIITLVYSGKCRQHGVDRITSQGLNLLTWEATRHFSPDIILNVGTSGGFAAQNTAVGDIYLSKDAIRYHDRLFGPDEYFSTYGVGHYPCLPAAKMAQDLHLKLGIVSTGNSLISSEAENQQMLLNDASVKDMEAAAIAEVAMLRNCPFLALKIISDLVDTDECPQNQFVNNFSKQISLLADKTSKVISYMLGKSLSEL